MVFVESQVNLVQDLYYAAWQLKLTAASWLLRPLSEVGGVSGKDYIDIWNYWCPVI